MAVDLPENVSQQILTRLVNNADSNSERTQVAATNANNVLMAASARNFDEIGIQESRATSGVIATPIAGPATQTGG